VSLREREKVQELLRTHGVKVLLTCGPASEPIDRVRRVTNHSTGELGTRLAEALVAAGHAVRCVRGVAATFPAPLAPVEVIEFGSTSECKEALRGQRGWPEVVLHLAALADFTPEAVQVGDGAWQRIGGAQVPGKISSAVEGMTVRFGRAEKVIGCLREFFPGAFLVGWKYEVDGTEQDALEKGRQQIAAHDLQACVVNGPTCGERLWLVRPGEAPQGFAHRGEFVQRVADLFNV
jgi:phosphopantothenoylcysteine synthetase/decarboxylase